MKAVVLETKQNTAAVLREDGVVLKVHGTYTVGETIELKEKPKFSFGGPQMRLAFTSIAIVLALIFGGVYNYTTVQAAGIVTVDEGAGLELVLNRRNQVIEVRATDEAGESIREQLEAQHIRGSSLEDAVHAINEIHHRDRKEAEPDTVPEDLTFHAVSDDEQRQDALNRELEHIHERGKPETEPESDSNETTSVPEEQPAEISEPAAPSQPQNAAPDNPGEPKPAEGQELNERPENGGEPPAQPMNDMPPGEARP